MNSPLISAIIPTYNARSFLPDAIASARAQRYPNLEILVVDDGSTDDTRQVVAEDSGVRYFQKANGGASSARNFGLRQARGEMIAFLDADDQWPENKLAVQMQRLAGDPNLDIVSGRIQYLQLPGADPLELRFEGPDQTVAHIHLGAALYRRRAFDVVGTFDEGLRIGHDQDWFLRARELGLRISILPEVTLLYRVHGSNRTHRANAHGLELMEVIHKSLVRRRGRGGTVHDLPKWSSFAERKPPNG
jgi:glycosyltransferase involved in cell wall biosynthesis